VELLFEAIQSGSLPSVRELLSVMTLEQVGTKEDTHGRTVAHDAAWNGHAHLLAELLLNYNAPHDMHLAATRTGWQPLHYCCRHSGDPQCVALLLEQGAPPGVVLADGWTPLMQVCRNSGNPKTVKLLVDRLSLTHIDMRSNDFTR
jgi:ankyrin repeat protein